MLMDADFNLCPPLKKDENLLIELQRNMPRYYYFVEIFFFKRFLIISELQTEKMNEFTRGSAAFLQTNAKEVCVLLF